jgi:myosin heavy subunit
LQSTLAVLDSTANERIFANFLKRKRTQQQSVIPPMTDFLNASLTAITANHLPESMRDFVFVVLCSHLNALLFNSVLDLKQLCNMSAALHLKMNVTQLENWIQKNVGKPVRNSLHHVRQLSDALILPKDAVLDKKTRAEVCPLLTPAHLYTALSNYTTDDLDTEGVPHDILTQLEQESRAVPQSSIKLPTRHAKALTSSSGQDIALFIEPWLDTIGRIQNNTTTTSVSSGGWGSVLASAPIPSLFTKRRGEFPQLSCLAS